MGGCRAIVPRRSPGAADQAVSLQHRANSGCGGGLRRRRHHGQSGRAVVGTTTDHQRAAGPGRRDNPSPTDAVAGGRRRRVALWPAPVMCGHRRPAGLRPGHHLQPAQEAWRSVSESASAARLRAWSRLNRIRAFASFSVSSLSL